jgi:uncharacterized integral membrane protein
MMNTHERALASESWVQRAWSLIRARSEARTRMSNQNPPPSAPPPQGSKPPSQRPRLTPGQIAGAVLLVLALVFIFENTSSVKVRMLFPQLKVPLFIALLLAAVLGSLVTLLIQWRRRSRKGQP